MIEQKEITLNPMSKGFHNIDRIISGAFGKKLPKAGLINIFVKHTSAALMINENADPDVQVDMKTLLNKLAPEGAPFYEHTMEGTDDMPAHFKSSVFGQSLTVPITNGNLNLGTWQSVYFCEFRNYGGSRKIVVTIYS
ncbi:MAG: YjbQ family protein [Bacteroidetes bacterium]|nr:YjbQ family protein [Bacteroidota bacterium]MBL6943973.1 YjbQ family protein [Bacteroidales bacterium]